MKFFLNKRFIVGFFLGFLASPILIVAAFLVVRQYAIAVGPENMRMPVLPDAQADYDWTMKTLADESVNFSEFKGKTIFMTVWKPGCDICEAELPVLQDLFEQVSDFDVAFIALATAYDDKILEFIAEYDLTFPIYYQAEDGRPDMYSTGNVPSSFIVSPDGRLLMRHRGAARWDDGSVAEYLKGLALGDSRETTPNGAD